MSATATKLLRSTHRANEQIAMFIYEKELIFTVSESAHAAGAVQGLSVKTGSREDRDAVARTL
jgi:hypothetical protein